MAGAMGYAPVEAAAHALEDALSPLREGPAVVETTARETQFGAALDALADAVEASITLGAPSRAGGVTPARTGVSTPLDRSIGAEAAPSSAMPSHVAHRTRTLPVDVLSLDRLLDLSGTLGAVRERLSRAVARVGDAELARAAADLARVSRALSDEVRAARLVAVAELLDELPRAARAAARESGKQVALETAGGAVVADRAVIDALSEPLTHLLRNAVDHGIETPADREHAGKAIVGRVAVRASREGNSLVVEVEDDGRGIDRQAVVARARGRLPAADAVAPGAAVDDATLLACLALPGLTTARTVGRLSGRGVGVDAALARVRALGGALSVRSTVGKGTCFTLRMPLAWAVVPVLLVRAAAGVYALPLAHVRGTRTSAAEAALPLSALLGRGGLAARPVPECDLVAVSAADGATFELAVDEVIGATDCVLKPVAAPRGAFRVVVGATILDGGDVVLVLDVPAVVARRTDPAPR